jgi:hypothetical protein
MEWLIIMAVYIGRGCEWGFTDSPLPLSKVTLVANIASWKSTEKVVLNILSRVLVTIDASLDWRIDLLDIHKS